MMIESIKSWPNRFIVPTSQFELLHKMNGNKISLNFSKSNFTSFGTTQNFFEGMEETVEAVI